MLTYIPEKNCDYVVVSFQVVVDSQIGANIRILDTFHWFPYKCGIRSPDLFHEFVFGDT